MVVDLPEPGAPVMPTRMALPVRGSSSCTSLCAARRWSPRLLSISVMARASVARSLCAMAQASAAISGDAGWGREAMKDRLPRKARRWHRAWCAAQARRRPMRQMLRVGDAWCRALRPIRAVGQAKHQGTDVLLPHRGGAGEGEKLVAGLDAAG